MRTSKLKFTTLTDQLGQAADQPDAVSEVSFPTPGGEGGYMGDTWRAVSVADEVRQGSHWFLVL